MGLRLETARLNLQLLDSSHADLMAQFLRTNEAHFAPTSPPQAPDVYEASAWSRRLKVLAERFEAQQELKLGLFRKEASPLIGELTFSGVVKGPFLAAYLGYRLDKDHVGHGYMQEAMEAAIAWVFEHWGLHRIMANYMPTNERSGKLLRRLGFVPEGYARDYLFLDGKWQDHILTSLTNPKALPQ